MPNPDMTLFEMIEAYSDAKLAEVEYRLAEGTRAMGVTTNDLERLRAEARKEFVAKAEAFSGRCVDALRAGYRIHLSIQPPLEGE